MEFVNICKVGITQTNNVIQKIYVWFCKMKDTIKIQGRLVDFKVWLFIDRV